MISVDLWNSLRSNLGVLALLLALGLVIATRRQYATASKGRTLPPGPPGKPMIGSILEVAQLNAPCALTRYGEQYGKYLGSQTCSCVTHQAVPGDLVMFRGLGKNVLVLNSLRAINDLFDKRAANYSNRPTVVFLPYGDEWRAHRKLMHSALGPAQIKQYNRIQEDAAALMTKALIDKPEQFWGLVRTYVAKVIIAITYGISASSIQDELIKMGEEVMEISAKAALPGHYLCDSIPLFKYAPPWVAFQREARRGRAMVQRFITEPIEHIKRDMENDTAPPSFTRDLLSLPEEEAPERNRRLPWVSGTMFNGMISTYSTVLSFILAMALNPEKQKLAQAEIDAVIGEGRLPTLADRQDLPYVNAIVKEVMRWLPTVPLGVPRCSVQEDFHGDYYIPKDTVLIPNVWYTSHDRAIAFEPNVKYDPQTFLPERFLDDSTTTPDPTAWAFGFGRRICPGRHLAENSLFIIVATMLTVFNISPPKDGTIPEEFTSGTGRYVWLCSRITSYITYIIWQDYERISVLFYFSL
ncbi:hypothetical protein CERSUDRAFT_53073 [Gelatoporia subvermispora B]|uniref:Cytochrome P450 n=1 Tax=Ceriporiopsis subvermispora (strain B) TaxID=914234 RepID=M2QFZ8_CERS8|nr:hypothetical protein CERSUDRAFT_53073 [Gelatoporia subvermispora B]